MTADAFRGTVLPAPAVPALTVRRHIDQALVCSACCH